MDTKICEDISYLAQGLQKLKKNIVNLDDEIKLLKIENKNYESKTINVEPILLKVEKYKNDNKL